MDVTILNYVQNHCHNRFTDFFFTFPFPHGKRRSRLVLFCFLSVCLTRTKSAMR